MNSLPETTDAAARDAVVAADADYRIAPPVAGSAYAGFDLPAGDLATVPQFLALQKDPEIAAYLKSGNGEEPPSRRARRGIAFFLFAAAILLAVYLLPAWSMFSRYRPTLPAETQKPAPYAGDVPLLLRDRIGGINADIAAGDRWRPAFAKLSALVDDLDAGKISAPEELRRWARCETLVAMASKEIPPSYPDAYPERVFGGLVHAVAQDPDFVIPYRAGAAYVRLLRSAPQTEATARDADRRILEALERLRSEHGRRLDADRELLGIEAKCHIAAIPKEYTPNDRYLDYHWRRASHAISRLYSLHGTSDAQAKSLDHARWRTIAGYFDLTLLTWDVERLGWRKTVVLDGKEYSRDDVAKILEQLKSAF